MPRSPLLLPTVAAAATISLCVACVRPWLIFHGGWCDGPFLLEPLWSLVSVTGTAILCIHDFVFAHYSSRSSLSSFRRFCIMITIGNGVFCTRINYLFFDNNVRRPSDECVHATAGVMRALINLTWIRGISTARSSPTNGFLCSLKIITNDEQLCDVREGKDWNWKIG